MNDRACRPIVKLVAAIAFALLLPGIAIAACDFSPQGSGRVVAIIDARTFRLEDGREVRLAGIETDVGQRFAPASGGLNKIIGRDVTLQADDDKPDRYGRQIAVVFAAGSETSVQTEMLSQGEAVVSGIVPDKACFAEWTTAESAARTAKQGFWSDASATKNAEMPGDILARIGRFVIVEGMVLSARQAGATFYVNFGRRWTRDFAVTISRRMVPAFEASGLDLTSLVGKKIRVRGWVEKRGGPRIAATRTGQIEMITGAGEIAKTNMPLNEGK